MIYHVVPLQTNPSQHTWCVCVHGSRSSTNHTKVLETTIVVATVLDWTCLLLCILYLWLLETVTSRNGIALVVYSVVLYTAFLSAGFFWSRRGPAVFSVWLDGSTLIPLTWLLAQLLLSPYSCIFFLLARPGKVITYIQQEQKKKGIECACSEAYRAHTNAVVTSVHVQNFTSVWRLLVV